jgi:hypothetical protein
LILFAVFTPVGRWLKAFGGWILSSLFTSYRRRRDLRRLRRAREVEFLAEHSDIRAEVTTESTGELLVGLLFWIMARTQHSHTSAVMSWWDLINQSVMLSVSIAAFLLGRYRSGVAREARDLARERRTEGAPLASPDITESPAPGPAP